MPNSIMPPDFAREPPEALWNFGYLWTRRGLSLTGSQIWCGNRPDPTRGITEARPDVAGTPRTAWDQHGLPHFVCRSPVFPVNSGQTIDAIAAISAVDTIFTRCTVFAVFAVFTIQAILAIQYQ